VVVFPDNAFKYASSMQKHLPELFSGAKPGGASVNSNLSNIVDFARSSSDVIDPEDAKAWLESSKSPTLIDVRGADEYTEDHAKGAVNVPLPDLAAGDAMSLLPDDKDAPIVTICKVGERSLYGMLLLKSLGYQRVKSIRGGLQAWIAAGLPTSASR
jgi:rhodanese-related sulfurtransferase